MYNVYIINHPQRVINNIKSTHDVVKHAFWGEPRPKGNLIQ